MEKKAYDYERECSVFLEKIGSEEKLETVSEFSRLIRSHIQENSFAAKILPPEQVNMTHCQISKEPQNDTFEIILWKEPDARAQILTNKATSDSEYIYADRVGVPFGVIASRKFEKSEDEIRIYKGINLTEMVEAHAAKAIGDIQDYSLISLARQAVRANGMDFSSGGQPFTKDVLITLLNAPHQHQMKTTITLMTETTFNNFARQGTEVFGDSLVGEIIRDGMKFKTLMGHPVITTLKNYILNDNEIFSFPAPEYLGKFYVLDPEKFIVKKDDGIVSWYCKKNIAMAFININGVVRMRLQGFGD